MVVTERRKVDEPPRLVKTQLAKIVSEVWARQLILNQFGLGEAKTSAPKPRGSHYIVYDLADGPKRHQVRRPRGVRVDLHHANVRRVIGDAIRASADTWVKEQISEASARDNFERWQRKSKEELAKIIKDGIAQDLDLQTSLREAYAALEMPSRDLDAVDYDMVDRLIDEAGAEKVARALWMYELTAGETPWYAGLSSTFREERLAGFDSSRRDFFLGAGRNFENIDLDLLEEVVNDPPWSLPRNLRDVIGNGHPDFVVVEAIQIGKARSRAGATSVWTAAHIFEIKANTSKLTRTQEETLARAQGFDNIHYTLLHFDFDMTVGSTTITETRFE